MPLVCAAAPSLETPVPAFAHAPLPPAAQCALRLPPVPDPTVSGCATATTPSVSAPQVLSVLEPHCCGSLRPVLCANQLWYRYDTSLARSALVHCDDAVPSEQPVCALHGSPSP